jgi:dTDP-glucose pyrophosphorylase
MNNWKKLCLLENCTILMAMKNLDETGAKILMVVSSDWKLKGSLSDGDIRRALLNGLSVNDLVYKAMNEKPIFASTKLNKFELFEKMKSSKITHIPILNDSSELVSIYSLNEFQKEEIRKENAVVIMAGGLGSRLGELTANCPKPMLKLSEKPILEIIIESLKDYGFYNFFLSVNYKSEMIENYFGHGERHGVSIDYIREIERMGTAGSLSLFKPINDLPIVVMNGDVLSKVNFTSLLEFQSFNEFDACMCTFRHDYQIPFGVVHFEGDLILKVEEKPIHSSLVNAGIYSFNSKLLSLIPKNTFVDMPTFLEKIIFEKYRLGAYQVQDYWLDIGRRDDFHRAEKDFKNKIGGL